MGRIFCGVSRGCLSLGEPIMFSTTAVVTPAFSAVHPCPGQLNREEEQLVHYYRCLWGEGREVLCCHSLGRNVL